ncbi:hypothetical protein M9Y10_016454 [Tritrichomonas musculus]|uniref:Myb-like DNA-binding domain containing protein n=1 Tax=Tritrichomonas musculus TaxID=1915356 RepID=A0ABR2HW86_9EUKA
MFLNSKIVTSLALMIAVSGLEQTAFIGAPVFKPPTAHEIHSNSSSKSYPTPQLYGCQNNLLQNFNYSMNLNSTISNPSLINNVDPKSMDNIAQYNNSKFSWGNNQCFALNQQPPQISPLNTPLNKQIFFSSPINNPNSPPKVVKKQKQRHFTMKIKFTPEEDALLLSLVQEHGSKDWIKISHLMNGTRNPRQCRERYKNYINPDLRKDNWTKEEDELLIQKYSEYGGKWNKIAKFFVNRSDNHLRNRWMMIARHRAKGDTDFIERSFTVHNNTDARLTSKQSLQSSPNESVESPVVERFEPANLTTFPQTQESKNHLKSVDPEVEELSTANFWLNESAFNLLGLQNNGFELFGNDQSELWPGF